MLNISVHALGHHEFVQWFSHLLCQFKTKINVNKKDETYLGKFSSKLKHFRSIIAFENVVLKK